MLNKSLTAPIVFYRTYSRLLPSGNRENWADMVDRATKGLIELGKLTPEETELIRSHQTNFTALTSGRWQWVGGTDWVSKPKNFQGAYNCSNLIIDSFQRMAYAMDLLMQGCGVGTIIETDVISKLPVICNRLELEIIGEPGGFKDTGVASIDKTLVFVEQHTANILVGDSRKGWVDAYQKILELFADPESKANRLIINLSNIRAAGTPIKGFGGVANPVGLNRLFIRMVEILNGAVGRKLNSLEVCLLMDESALAVVAGNVRRSANIRQFSSDDVISQTAKDNLWIESDKGWYIDPERDALRMSNHTRVFHYKPTLQECIDAVRKQYYSGEGAIQWAGESVARANADILKTLKLKTQFLAEYNFSREAGKEYLVFANKDTIPDEELDHRMMRYGTNPCFAAGTMILTRKGHFPIESLVGKTVEIWDGNSWVEIDNFRVTGENQSVYSVNLQNGSSIVATEYHSFVLESGEKLRLRELKPGNRLLTHDRVVDTDLDTKGAYLKGFLIGDGTNSQNQAVLALYAPKYCCQDRLLLSARQVETKQLATHGNSTTQYNYSDWGFRGGDYGRKYMQGLSQCDLLYWAKEAKSEFPVEVFNWSLTSKCEFIAGAMDADGYAMDSTNGFGYQISSIHKQWLEGFQLLLKTLGINSKLNPVRKGGSKDFGDKKGGIYSVKDIYRLTIAQASSIKLAKIVVFSRLTSFAQRSTKYSANLRWNKVESIEFSHVADKVYCCTVPTNHQVSLSNGITTLQCGEIVLNDNFCNLSDVHLNLIDPFNLYTQKCAFEAAALSATVLLHHQFNDDRMRQSRELDPIVGVSITGLFDFFVHAFGAEWLEWWKDGRHTKWDRPSVSVEIKVAAEMANINIDRYENSTETAFNLGALFQDIEQFYLSRWRSIVEQTVWAYCDRHNLKRPNRCTTVQPSGCLDRTALRIFDQGLLYADEIVAEGSGETVGLDLSVRSGIPVNAAIANQPLNLIKVTLRNGRQLRMTPNHRMSIRGQWVEAISLKPGMVIDYQIGCYQKLDEAKLIGINHENYTRASRAAESGNNRGVIAQAIFTPSVMSPDLGYFLGALFGNGCFSESHYRIRFAHEYCDVLSRLSQIGIDLFGLRGNMNEDLRGRRSELCFASKQLFDWFHQNNIAKTVKSKDLVRIPEPIRRSSRETLLSFFCGLIDTDGCIRANGALSIESASEDFIRNLQQVGEAIGLSFGISHNTQGSNHQAVKSIWSLSLSRTKSTPEAIAYLNEHSTKTQSRPISFSIKTNGVELYAIVSVQPETVSDYSYDFAVEGVDDDDSWYWQGGLKSHNTKSLLTGASPGWHPPKSQRFIRRITFRKNDPVALACMDYGYSVIPSQSDKDEYGNLLDDAFDPRCTEWLVEVPIAVSWADIPGTDSIDISQFSALAQFDFYMQIQRHYTTHNTSATIEFRKHEIEELGSQIWKAIESDEGYISVALLARFDSHQTFPRLPFEPIDKATYDRLMEEMLSRRKIDSFDDALALRDREDGVEIEIVGSIGCDSDKCLLPEKLQ